MSYIFSLFQNLTEAIWNLDGVKYSKPDTIFYNFWELNKAQLGNILFVMTTYLHLFVQ